MCIRDRVKAGEPIALGGNTGRSTGSHLHLSLIHILFERNYVIRKAGKEDPMFMDKIKDYICLLYTSRHNSVSAASSIIS